MCWCFGLTLAFFAVADTPDTQGLLQQAPAWPVPCRMQASNCYLCIHFGLLWQVVVRLNMAQAQPCATSIGA